MALTAIDWEADEADDAAVAVVITISPRHAALPEMPARRDYRVYLHGAPASQYRLDGQVLERETSAGGSVYRVDVGGVATGAECVLRIVAGG